MGKGTRILITGSRNWEDAWICAVLHTGIRVHERFPFHIYHGGARGADTIYAAEATYNADPEMTIEHRFDAEWKRYGKSAGPKRNQKMLAAFLNDLQEGEVYFALAFNDDLENSKGTKDMIKRLKKANVPVYLVSHL